MIVGSLGEIVFEVSNHQVFAPDQFSLSREIKYEDHAIPGDFPRPEYIAPDLFSTTLEVILRADLGCQPWEEAVRMEACAISGEVLRLIIGNSNFGKCTIRKITQKWLRLSGPGGSPAAIGISLDLKEYV